MAKIAYGTYLSNVSHCCIITNFNGDFVEDLWQDDFFEKPSIKMSILETSEENVCDIFDLDAGEFNHPDLKQNWQQIMQNESPNWWFVGANVSVEGIYLVYVTTLPDAELEDGCSGDEALVCIRGNEHIKVLFETDYEDGLPPERNIIEMNQAFTDKGVFSYSEVIVTKFIGKRKLRKVELRSDNYGMPFIAGKQYAIITDY